MKHKTQQAQGEGEKEERYETIQDAISFLKALMENLLKQNMEGFRQEGATGTAISSRVQSADTKCLVTSTEPLAEYLIVL